MHIHRSAIIFLALGIEVQFHTTTSKEANHQQIQIEE